MWLKLISLFSIIVLFPAVVFSGDHNERKTLPKVANEVYRANCGSCHFAYQPGLLPAKSWQKIIDSPGGHAGGALSLDKKAKTEIRPLFEEAVANYHYGNIGSAERVREVVKAARWDDVYGNVIEIEHNDSLSTIYGHNEKILVKEGEYVTRGQVIATVGNTGRSTAPHLHFEVLKNREPVDPEAYVVFKSE